MVRLSLDALKSARKKRETYVGSWLPEPVSGSVVPDTAAEIADSLSIAFLHLLESLSAPERAAFLLHDVFDEGYPEIAGILNTTEVNVRQAVSRARKHLRERRPRFAVDRSRSEALLRTFLEACQRGDADSLLSVLKEDVVLYADGGGKARAAINPIYGADRVTRFMLGIASQVRAEVAGGYFADVNGQPGFVYTESGEPRTIFSLDVDDDGRIRNVYLVVNPAKLAAWLT